MTDIIQGAVIYVCHLSKGAAAVTPQNVYGTLTQVGGDGDCSQKYVVGELLQLPAW